MADLPSGAVTFLFTDIEGSTRLVKLLRERYGEVLQEHQRLLRAAFEAHRGYEVDTQGDSFFVAFSSARDALMAAVEGQLAISSHSWPDGEQIKVRMGLHTGQAIATGGRYTGLAVHRAARIGGAGYGGQILVSQATQTLLEDEEEDLHIHLRDLGEQRLKDLDRPVRIYQAAADGLPLEFPPLRGPAELEHTAGTPIESSWWRRRAAVVAAALVVIAAVVAVAALALRDSSSGLAGVRANAVGVLDPETNEIVAEVPVGMGNLEDRTLTRIDSAERSAVATVSLDNKTPTGLAVGGGAVWVGHGMSGQVARVDVQFNRVTSSLDVATRTARTGVVAVGDGSVWAAFGDSTIARIEPTDARVAASAFTGGVSSAIVVGSGAVWVTNSADSTVERFNPATFEQGAVRAISVGRRPTGIAFREGAVWVANTGD
ncbi:MAG: adenylate/guanylate cyclase domain-containing protein, partial [Actinomycetota bacterium]